MTGPPPDAGAYSEAVRVYFAHPAHAGDPPGGNVIVAEASESADGARIVLAARVERGRLCALRYRVFGCPHLIAALEAFCTELEGRDYASLSDWRAADAMQALGVPIEKTGRILLIEDAAAALRSRVEATPS